MPTMTLKPVRPKPVKSGSVGDSLRAAKASKSPGPCAETLPIGRVSEKAPAASSSWREEMWSRFIIFHLGVSPGRHCMRHADATSPLFARSDVLVGLVAAVPPRPNDCTGAQENIRFDEQPAPILPWSHDSG